MTTELAIMDRLEAITPLTPPEEVVNLLNLIAEAEKRLAELKDRAKDALKSALEQAPGKSVTVGPIRYYIGTKRTTKPVTLNVVADALLTATAGDVTTFVECLSANAFKPGKCREVLGDATWDAVFNVEEETEVREGKPERVKRVLSIDTRFVKGGSDE